MRFCVLLLAVGVGVVGCKDNAGHVNCRTDADCKVSSPGGVCVNVSPGQNVCANPDGGCPSGLRYDPSASLNQACVPGLSDMGVVGTGDQGLGDMSVAADMATMPADMARPVQDLSYTPVDLAGVDMAGSAALTWSAKVDGDPGDNYSAVFGSSATDVWIVGTNASGSTTAKNTSLVHYDGAAVVKAANVGASVWALAAGQGWSVFNNQIYSLVNAGQVANSVYTGTSSYNLAGIWGASSSALWAVGNQGVILHGTSATTWAPAAGAEGSGCFFAGVWGTSATNVYVVGTNGFSPYNPVVYRSTDGDSFSALMLPSTQAHQGATAVWGSGPNDIYVVGANGLVLHSTDGSTWTAEDTGVTNSFYSVYGSGPQDVFIVGTAGIILHSNGNGSWLVQNSGTGQTLTGVWAASPSDVWAVGNGGTILHATTN